MNEKTIIDGIRLLRERLEWYVNDCVTKSIEIEDLRKEVQRLNLLQYHQRLR